MTLSCDRHGYGYLPSYFSQTDSKHSKILSLCQRKDLKHYIYMQVRKSIQQLAHALYPFIKQLHMHSRILNTVQIFSHSKNSVISTHAFKILQQTFLKNVLLHLKEVW